MFLSIRIPLTNISQKKLNSIDCTDTLNVLSASISLTDATIVENRNGLSKYYHTMQRVADLFLL